MRRGPEASPSFVRVRHVRQLADQLQLVVEVDPEHGDLAAPRLRVVARLPISYVRAVSGFSPAANWLFESFCPIWKYCNEPNEVSAFA